MFSQGLLDPTAGERARRISERPAEPQRIFDPTDPRCGQTVPSQPAGAAAAAPRAAPRG